MERRIIYISPNPRIKSSNRAYITWIWRTHSNRPSDPFYTPSPHLGLLFSKAHFSIYKFYFITYIFVCKETQSIIFSYPTEVTKLKKTIDIILYLINVFPILKFNHIILSIFSEWVNANLIFFPFHFTFPWPLWSTFTIVSGDC